MPSSGGRPPAPETGAPAGAPCAPPPGLAGSLLQKVLREYPRPVPQIREAADVFRLAAPAPPDGDAAVFAPPPGGADSAVHAATRIFILCFLNTPDEDAARGFIAREALPRAVARARRFAEWVLAPQGRPPFPDSDEEFVRASLDLRDLLVLFATPPDAPELGPYAREYRQAYEAGDLIRSVLPESGGGGGPGF